MTSDPPLFSFSLSVILACLSALLPLFSFLILFPVGKRLPRQGDWLAISLAGASLLLSLCLLFQIWNRPASEAHFTWFSLPGGRLFVLTLLLDRLSTAMLCLLGFISLLVQVYSVKYMHDERNYGRYYAYLGLFTFAMMGLVLVGNLLVMYAFWELVGLSSYLLIGFWLHRPKAVAASKKAFLFNRVGDVGFLIGIMLLYAQFGTTNLMALSAQVIPAEGWMTLIGLCLFTGCVGKSAQFPLQSWLPDAMEGPTPVSALIHAATMVAAGIYLLARIHGLLTPDALLVIALVGVVTAFMGAFSALFQNDIKKVLAFSTISQLGLMVMGMGVGAREASVFHLFTHAFFKAGLFLCAGAVIHSVHAAAAAAKDPALYAEYDTHDMRRMGGLRRRMPFTFLSYIILGASLAGIPLFSGFLSKDAILVESFTWASEGAWWYLLVPLLAFMSVLMTAFYVGRQLFMVFGGSWRGAQGIRSFVREVPWLMRFPLLLLAVLSIGFVFSSNPLNTHQAWLLQSFAVKEVGSGRHWTGLVYLSVALSLIGAGLSYLQFRQKQSFRKLDFRNQMPHIRRRFARDTRAMQPLWLIYRLSVHNWYLDRLYYHGVERPFLAIAAFLYSFDRRFIDQTVEKIGITYVVLGHMVSWFDRTVVDGMVNFAAYLAGGIGRLTRSFQNGRVQVYFLFALLGLVFVAIWIIL
jgi:NADH-quinone oxidoreductase subunit L